MNWHVWSWINLFILLHGSAFSPIRITWTSCIQSNEEFFQDECNNYINKRHNTLNCVCCDNLNTYINIPLREIIRERTIKHFEESWRSLLIHICIHNQNNQSSIKELTKESSFYHWSFLLTNSVFTNPRYKHHNH